MNTLQKVLSWGKKAVQTVSKGVESVLSVKTIEQIKKDTIDYTTGKTNKTLEKIGLDGAVAVRPAYYDRYKPMLFIGSGLLLVYLLFIKK